jgi:hypothetical protein
VGGVVEMIAVVDNSCLIASTKCETTEATTWLTFSTVEGVDWLIIGVVEWFFIRW